MAKVGKCAVLSEQADILTSLEQSVVARPFRAITNFFREKNWKSDIGLAERGGGLCIGDDASVLNVILCATTVQLLSLINKHIRENWTLRLKLRDITIQNLFVHNE